MTDITRDARSDRTDFWTGLVLAAIGLAFAVQSWRMPRLEERGINPLTAPGIVPGVLGAALLVLGLLLAFRSRSPARTKLGLETIIGTGSGRTRLLVTLALNVVFALVLIGRTPFWFATLFYLMLFMGIFGMGEATAETRRKRAIVILVVSSAVTAGIVYLFGELFFVRLP